MNTPSSDFSSEAAETLPTAKPKRVPRLRSLAHRLLHLKDANGQPIPLHDELLFFLEIPPEGTRDRWQKGADLCAGHGIQTSRMAVWRFYHANILEWRRAQAPPLPIQPPKPEETAALHEMARHFAAQRTLDFLRDPALSPGHLVGLIQNDNHRQKIQLGRDQFNERLTVRRMNDSRRLYKSIEASIRDKHLFEYQLKSVRKSFSILLNACSKSDQASHTTS
jgi:hypothetical protein